ncbi:hypothetical protein C4F49_13285 [Sphingobacterium sp. KB22]|uniref:Uncharacterized protein n=1 Tax=Sphingobacterium hungaricum TaxID=2082723 RepID=A0A928YQV4_9SPHI|nr:hypothetical protein [Sphingobacterium hungaricum]
MFYFKFSVKQTFLSVKIPEHLKKIKKFINNIWAIVINYYIFIAENRRLNLNTNKSNGRF